MKRLFSLSLPVIALAAVLVAVATLLLHGGSTASAHASLMKSNPTDKQVLAATPTAIAMTFSQNLADTPGSFIWVTLNGESVVAGDTTVSPTDTKTMSVPLNDGLGAGKYFVFWKSTSADDGGVTFGRFTFFVGTPDPADVANTPAGTSVEVPDDATDLALSSAPDTSGGNPITPGDTSPSESPAPSGSPVSSGTPGGD